VWHFQLVSGDQNNETQTGENEATPITKYNTLRSPELFTQSFNSSIFT